MNTRLSLVLCLGALALCPAFTTPASAGGFGRPTHQPRIWKHGEATRCHGQQREIKNIILFIGDGMQLEHEIAASRYLYGSDFGLPWNRFSFSAPVATWDVSTYNKTAKTLSLPSYDTATFEPAVGYNWALGGAQPFPADETGIDNYFLKLSSATDSASAATAWATGCKTDDGNIAWTSGDPADGALKTIAELVRDQKGASIGVVSTVPFNHATPAAHVAHNVNRNNYIAIADEIINTTKPDVVIGGGHPSYTSGYMNTELRDTLAASPDYVFVERTAGVEGGAALRSAAKKAVAQKKKLFGLFGGPGGNFESPVPANSPGAPSVSRGSIENPLLEDATVAALSVLSQDRDGFFVMIEQGDIDWANHSNAYNQMIGCMWDLDRAVRAAVAYVNKPGDGVTWQNTLIIVTSDHSNSYMRLRRENGVPVLGKGELPASQGKISIGSDFKPVYAPEGAPVFYGSGGHTNEPTMLYALGAGTGQLGVYRGVWYPGTSLIDNTQLFEAMAAAFGLKEGSTE